MATFIGTTAGYYGRSLHGHNQAPSSSSLDYTRDIYRYQILYSNVIQILNSYINYFTTGDYENLKDNFTTKRQNLLTSILQNSDYYYNTNIDNLVDFTYDTSMFENFRNNTYYILDGLIQAVSQYDTVDALQNEVSACKSIIASEETITEYLNSNKQASVVAFTANQKFNTSISLKPWYERYLILYGAPNDGIFLTEKMAVVVQLLIDEEVITLDQFTSNSYP
jgi:hypothetical protein